MLLKLLLFILLIATLVSSSQQLKLRKKSVGHESSSRTAVSKSKVHELFQSALKRLPSFDFKRKMDMKRRKSKNRIKFGDVVKKVMNRYNSMRKKKRMTLKDKLCRRKRNLKTYFDEKNFFLEYLKRYAPHDVSSFETAVQETGRSGIIKDWKKIPSLHVPSDGDAKEEYIGAVSKMFRTIQNDMTRGAGTDYHRLKDLYEIGFKAWGNRVKLRHDNNNSDKNKLDKLEERIKELEVILSDGNLSNKKRSNFEAQLNNRRNERKEMIDIIVSHEKMIKIWGTNVSIMGKNLIKLGVTVTLPKRRRFILNHLCF